MRPACHPGRPARDPGGGLSSKVIDLRALPTLGLRPDPSLPLLMNPRCPGKKCFNDARWERAVRVAGGKRSAATGRVDEWSKPTPAGVVGTGVTPRTLPGCANDPFESIPVAALRLPPATLPSRLRRETLLAAPLYSSRIMFISTSPPQRAVSLLGMTISRSGGSRHWQG